ncbi:hypothetical protein AB4915_09865 [Bifidobacterium dentium]|uniref:hypothetical protein n=1 Tax=Bifidobacterium dentium TaxID=1689 RepID=UPI003D17DA0A
MDYATLVTCTPYGVNTHRLLVRGHRIANPDAADTTDYDARIRLMSAIIITTTLLVLTAIFSWLAWTTRPLPSRRRGRCGRCRYRGSHGTTWPASRTRWNDNQRRHAKEWRK